LSSLDLNNENFLIKFCNSKIEVQKSKKIKISLGKKASPGYPGKIDLDLFVVSKNRNTKKNKKNNEMNKTIFLLFILIMMKTGANLLAPV
jgi:hypothetical protein